MYFTTTGIIISYLNKSNYKQKLIKKSISDIVFTYNIFKLKCFLNNIKELHSLAELTPI